MLLMGSAPNSGSFYVLNVNSHDAPLHTRELTGNTHGMLP